MQESSGAAPQRPLTGLTGSTDCLQSADAREFLAALDAIPEPHSRAIDPGADIFVARAPGRLDVFGGFADYSGSMALQMPTAEACFAAAQVTSAGTATPTLKALSLRAQPNGQRRLDAWTSPLGPLVRPLNYCAAGDLFRGSEWAAYIAGAAVVLGMEGLWPVNAVNASVNAVNVLIVVRSNVAEGRGVASSAAVEVAAMKALLAAVGRADLPGRDLALLCQKVENLVVGAPCGVMDQMASAMGPPARLLPILCHTAEAQPPISIPDHIRLYGIDSGVLHSVRDDAYCRVRAAAFMGLKMISDMKKVLPSCLAALSPSEWIGDLEEILPAEISGEEFLAAHGPHVDHVTTVDDHMHYRIRAATRHPILENFRVKLFRQLLGAPPSNAQLLALGELMFQSHASYRACGLGSKGTDAIVDLVKHEADLVTGQRPGVDQVNTQALTLGGVFGAKSSGAGCGGTVCVMASNDDAGRAAVERVAREYGERYGIEGRIFDMKYGERHRACSWCVKVCREG